MKAISHYYCIGARRAKKILFIVSILQGSEILVDDEEHIEKQRMTIREAFASDDVIEEFRQEKEDIEDRDKPKDIDMTLPGWGEWAGAGIDSSKSKKKKKLVVIFFL